MTCGCVTVTGMIVAGMIVVAGYWSISRGLEAVAGNVSSRCHCGKRSDAAI
jgi:hypothetical protein